MGLRNRLFESIFHVSLEPDFFAGRRSAVLEISVWVSNKGLRQYAGQLKQ